MSGPLCSGQSNNRSHSFDIYRESSSVPLLLQCSRPSSSQQAVERGPLTEPPRAQREKCTKSNDYLLLMHFTEGSLKRGGPGLHCPRKKTRWQVCPSTADKSAGRKAESQQIAVRRLLY